jgi:hypothetical protein
MRTGQGKTAAGCAQKSAASATARATAHIPETTFVTRGIPIDAPTILSRLPSRRGGYTRVPTFGD